MRILKSQHFSQTISGLPFSTLSKFGLCKNLSVLKLFLGLPWWLSGKESTCQCKRYGFDPWSGKIAHAAEELSLCTTTIKPALQSPRAPTTEARAPQSLCSPTREATTLRSPHTATRDAPAHHTQRKAHTATKSQESQKRINKTTKRSS